MVCLWRFQWNNVRPWKVRGNPKEERKIKAFWITLEECNLFDVGYSGRWYTWEKGNSLTTNIRKHLDKGVATVEWLDLFSNVLERHLPHSHSDHCQLLVSSSPTSTKKRYNFRFETWWTLESKFEDFIKGVWNTSEGNVLSKLKRLRDDLRKWDKQSRYKRSEQKEVLT